MFVEWPDEELGALAVRPANVAAGQPLGLGLVYTAGRKGVGQGGCVRFQVPQPCPPPQNRSPLQPGYVEVSCAAARTQTSFQRRGHEKDERYVTRFGHSVYVTVMSGALKAGDTITLRYGKAAGDWSAFGEGEPTRAPFFTGSFPMLMACDPTGERAAPYSGMYRCVPDAALEVTPGEAARQTQTPARAHTIVSSVDALGNPVGPARLRPRGVRPEEKGVFFGDLHCHSVLSDGIGRPRDCYRFARERAGLDFCAVTDHAAYLSQDDWQECRDAAMRCDEPGAFVTLLGYELSHPLIGDKNLYYPGTDGPLLRERNLYTDELLPAEETVGLWKAHRALMMAHLHARHLLAFDHPELCRLVEIYSNWGCCMQAGAIPPFLPALRADFTGNYALDALRRGWRVGFTAGSDDHMGRPGVSGWHRVERVYRSGLTAVYAEELTRESVFAALWARHTYATTGARMYLHWTLEGKRPGDVCAVGAGALQGVLRIAAQPGRAQLLVDGRPVWSAEVDQPRTACDVRLPAQTGACYLHYTQRDGHQGWTSPIYLEEEPT